MRASLRSVTREHGRAAVAPDQEHFVRLDLSGRNFHAGRAGRHSRHREAFRIRPLVQQPLDVLDGHVSFDEVAGDSAVWHEPMPYGIPTRCFTSSRLSSLRTSTVKPAPRSRSTHSWQQPHVALLCTVTPGSDGSTVVGEQPLSVTARRRLSAIEVMFISGKSKEIFDRMNRMDRMPETAKQPSSSACSHHPVHPVQSSFRSSFRSSLSRN